MAQDCDFWETGNKWDESYDCPRFLLIDIFQTAAEGGELNREWWVKKTDLELSVKVAGIFESSYSKEGSLVKERALQFFMISTWLWLTANLHVFRAKLHSARQLATSGERLIRKSVIQTIPKLTQAQEPITFSLSRVERPEGICRTFCRLLTKSNHSSGN